MGRTPVRTVSLTPRRSMAAVTKPTTTALDDENPQLPDEFCLCAQEARPAAPLRRRRRWGNRACVTMFIIVDMRDTVRIPPHSFNSELLALSAALDEKYSNKVRLRK